MLRVSLLGKSFHPPQTQKCSGLKFCHPLYIPATAGLVVSDYRFTWRITSNNHLFCNRVKVNYLDPRRLGAKARHQYTPLIEIYPETHSQWDQWDMR
jgi:hypothetical protein